MSFLKKLFPFISGAAAAGGPLASLAAKAVGSVLGLNSVEASAPGIEEAISGATPEQIGQLREAENQFRIKMQELGFEHAESLERIAADDRASARAREEKTGDSWTPRLLAGVVTLGFFGVLVFLMLREVPAGAKEASLLLLGALSASFGAVVQYYFGSSAGGRVHGVLGTGSLLRLR